MGQTYPWNEAGKSRGGPVGLRETVLRVSLMSGFERRRLARGAKGSLTHVVAGWATLNPGDFACLVGAVKGQGES